MKSILSAALLTLLIISSPLFGQDSWPKEIPLSSGGKVVIYQPQVEGFEGNILHTRSAVSVRQQAKDEPVFGAVWADATMLTDKDTRMATLESIDITDVRFPNVEDQSKIDAFEKLLETEIPKWNLEISIDRIIASLESQGKIEDSDLNTTPPKIIYKKEPSTLVLIDGEPKVEKNDDLNMETVVNTPFFIVKNPDDKKFYLFGGDFWYVSGNVTSGWQPAGSLTGTMKELDKALQEQIAENQEDEKEPAPASPPSIVVSTEPAELIQSDGEADFQSIEGTSLLYMSNTTNDILMDISSQTYYVLLAGRWYNSTSLNGPWNYSPPDKLPSDFSKIPKGSEKDVVLANVAGTPEAREATMDAQIPQTAKVDRNSTSCTVEYDGKPKFEPIEGTTLQVAVNTSSTVLRANNKYYAVENGVWFVSNNAEGPWKVSEERPSEVEKIPASSPAYNTKYVYIYDVTPTYIYTGYTPGYLGCYVYGPTVVYGTGYYYRPWYGAYYYPRPVTWGFGMHYNPWTGWSMNFGFSVGFFSFSFGHGGYYGRPGGWWGPPMYRPPYRPPYYGGGGYYGGRRNNININGDVNINVGNNTNNLYRYRNDAVTRDRSSTANRTGSTRDRTNQNTSRDRAQNPSRDRTQNTTRDRANNSGVNTSDLSNRMQSKPTARPADRSKNNVYTDKKGDVYRQQNNGTWQQKSSNGWNKSSVTPSTRQNLNQQSQMRNRGTTRTNSYQRTQSRPAARPAPSGRRRGN